MLSRQGEIEISTTRAGSANATRVPYGAMLAVKDEQKVEKGRPIFEWDPYNVADPRRAEGVVRFVDIIDEVTVREELDEKTGQRQRVIIDDGTRRCTRPSILEAGGPGR